MPPQNETLKRYLDAGIAFTSMTQERAEAIVKDLIAAGEVQTEHAQAMVLELVDRSRKNTEKLLAQVRTEVRDQIKRLGLVSEAGPRPLREAPRPARRPAKKAAGQEGRRQEGAGQEEGRGQEGPGQEDCSQEDRRRRRRPRPSGRRPRSGPRRRRPPRGADRHAAPAPRRRAGPAGPCALPRAGPGGDRGRPGHRRRRAGRRSRPTWWARARPSPSPAPARRFVGRGGEKLAAALERFAIDRAGGAALDAGSSTGGFTDCLLQRYTGAEYITESWQGEVDVGVRVLLKMVGETGLEVGDLPVQLTDDPDRGGGGRGERGRHRLGCAQVLGAQRRGDLAGFGVEVALPAGPPQGGSDR